MGSLLREYWALTNPVLVTYDVRTLRITERTADVRYWRNADVSTQAAIAAASRSMTARLVVGFIAGNDCFREGQLSEAK